MTFLQEKLRFSCFFYEQSAFWRDQLQFVYVRYNMHTNKEYF